jgi:hypothetical protein
MKAMSVVIGLAYICLCACGGSTKSEVLGQCRLDATQFEAIHDKGSDGFEQFHKIGNMTELCMRAHGYKLDEELCPRGIRTRTDMSEAVFSEAKGIQRTEPLCYERE